MRKKRTNRTSAMQDALSVAQLSPGIASKRVGRLVAATPVRAFGMLANMMSEKTFVLAQACANSFAAAARAQLSLLRLASMPIGVGGPNGSREAALAVFRSSNEIARAALTPVAR